MAGISEIAANDENHGFMDLQDLTNPSQTRRELSPFGIKLYTKCVLAMCP